MRSMRLYSVAPRLGYRDPHTRKSWTVVSLCRLGEPYVGILEMCLWSVKLVVKGLGYKRFESG